MSQLVDLGYVLGSTGPTGPTGPTGETGPAGPTGPAGENATTTEVATESTDGLMSHSDKRKLDKRMSAVPIVIQEYTYNSEMWQIKLPDGYSDYPVVVNKNEFVVVVGTGERYEDDGLNYDLPWVYFYVGESTEVTNSWSTVEKSSLVVPNVESEWETLLTISPNRYMYFSTRSYTLAYWSVDNNTGENVQHVDYDSNENLIDLCMKDYAYDDIVSDVRRTLSIGRYVRKYPTVVPDIDNDYGGYIYVSKGSQPSLLTNDTDVKYPVFEIEVPYYLSNDDELCYWFQYKTLNELGPLSDFNDSTFPEGSVSNLSGVTLHGSATFDAYNGTFDPETHTSGDCTVTFYVSGEYLYADVTVSMGAPKNMALVPEGGSKLLYIYL